MTRLSPVSWKELIKGLKKHGFKGPYPGGKHPYMVKGDLVLTIPNPHGRPISVDLLSRIQTSRYQTKRMAEKSLITPQAPFEP